MYCCRIRIYNESGFAFIASRQKLKLHRAKWFHLMVFFGNIIPADFFHASLFQLFQLQLTRLAMATLHGLSQPQTGRAPALRLVPDIAYIVKRARRRTYCIQFDVDMGKSLLPVFSLTVSLDGEMYSCSVLP